MLPLPRFTKDSLVKDRPILATWTKQTVNYWLSKERQRKKVCTLSRSTQYALIP